MPIHLIGILILSLYIYLRSLSYDDEYIDYGDSYHLDDYIDCYDNDCIE